MTPSSDTPHIRAGGLVTVAFLKASLDEGNDHLGIFMPLVLDVIGRVLSQSFTTGDIQEALANTHGVAMPQQVVTTLLKRAVDKRYLVREAGRYRRNPARDLPVSNVPSEKSKIEQAQRNLAEALRLHAQKRDLTIQSTESALDMLFQFLETEQVGLLLHNVSLPETDARSSHRQRAIVADFLQNAIRDDVAFLSVLRGMLEGLVLYHAAFLPDLAAAGRRFRNLRVIFDSKLVRQALGYEGQAVSSLMRETVNVLKGSGVQCLLFDTSLHEIRRILKMFEARLATAQGRASLRSGPMDRHFLISRYTPSDVREMSALIEQEVVALGFQIMRAPKRIPEFTSGEALLAKRLSNPAKKDESEPRVIHDVDCVAGVLTLRRGYRSLTLEDAQVVFATDSALVIRNSKLWWELDEHESGIEPVIHIRALTNLAWLKKPSLCSDFKVRELVALCTAALRPEPKTWERFLRHLRGLEKANKLSSDETTTILVSAMSDQLLTEAALRDDGDDIDAATLDEIVDRVTTLYGEEALKQIDSVRSEYEGKLRDMQADKKEATQRAESAARTAAEEIRRRDLVIEGRARAGAHYLILSLRIFAFSILLVGAGLLVAEHPFKRSWAGIFAIITVAIFVVLEFIGILKHLDSICERLEFYLMRSFRDWLTGALSQKPRDSFLRFT